MKTILLSNSKNLFWPVLPHVNSPTHVNTTRQHTRVLHVMGNQESTLGTCSSCLGCDVQPASVKYPRDADAPDDARRPQYRGVLLPRKFSKGKGLSGRNSPTMGMPPAASVSAQHSQHSDVTDDCIQNANALGAQIQRLQIQLAEIKKRREAMARSKTCNPRELDAVQHELVSCHTELQAVILEKEAHMHHLEQEVARSHGRHVRTVHAHVGQGYRPRANHSPTRRHSSASSSPTRSPNLPTRPHSPSSPRTRLRNDAARSQSPLETPPPMTA